MRASRVINYHAKMFFESTVINRYFEIHPGPDSARPPSCLIGANDHFWEASKGFCKWRLEKKVGFTTARSWLFQFPLRERSQRKSGVRPSTYVISHLCVWWKRRRCEIGESREPAISSESWRVKDEAAKKCLIRRRIAAFARLTTLHSRKKSSTIK